MRFITFTFVGFFGLSAMANSLNQERVLQLSTIFASKDVQNVLNQEDRLVEIKYVDSFSAAMTAEFELSFDQSENCKNSKRSVVKVTLDTYRNRVTYVEARICK